MRINIAIDTLNNLLSDEQQERVRKTLEEILEEYREPSDSEHVEHATVDLDINALVPLLGEIDVTGIFEKVICQPTPEEEKPAAPAVKPFDQMHVHELREACKKAGIPYRRMRNADMVAALQAKAN